MAAAGAKRSCTEKNNGAIAKRLKQEDKPLCHRMQRSREFLDFLNLDPAYFDPQHDRCYCATCAARIPDLLERDQPH
eukprot:853725-Rhodomonas_salina.1